MSEDRKAILLRLDPRVHEAIQAWARDDLRSVNAQIEWILRRALEDARRLRPRDDPGQEPSATILSK